jgi:hypothetical protein
MVIVVVVLMVAIGRMVFVLMAIVALVGMAVRVLL